MDFISSHYNTNNEQIATDLLQEVTASMNEQPIKILALDIGNENTENIVLNITGHMIINGTIYAKHIADEELYLTNYHTSLVTYNLLPGDGTRIVYADSTTGVISIMLGTINNYYFERNRQITFKDISLQLGIGSTHDVNIVVPNCGTRIEYYHNGVLTVAPNAGYSINTNGGAVTLRYFISPIPNVTGTYLGTWIVESQFLGQPRILPIIGSRSTNNRLK